MKPKTRKVREWKAEDWEKIPDLRKIMIGLWRNDGCEYEDALRVIKGFLDVKYGRAAKIRFKPALPRPKRKRRGA